MRLGRVESSNFDLSVIAPTEISEKADDNLCVERPKVPPMKDFSIVV